MRLLFDELLSYRVARALRAIGITASHVGHEGDNAPARGSSDQIVLEHAVRTNQVIVTSNHDMILLCAEKRESVIWIDPRGRQIKLTELVPIVFGRVEEWAQMLADADGSVCIHVLRTKSEVMSLEDAAQRVRNRMRRLAARRRRRETKAVPKNVQRLASP